MKRPNPTTGMRHVAFNVNDIELCERFYVDLMGMVVEWRPDLDNVYLTSGNDNLALHKAKATLAEASAQTLDHIGFILGQASDVDEWYLFLLDNNVEMRTKPKTHRDGARSFYCYDPSGIIVQIIYHPPIAIA